VNEANANLSDPQQVPQSGPNRANWPQRIAIALFLILAVGVGSAIRINTTLNDPSFDRQDAHALLKSDPGLIYYITERIVDAGGLPPADFRADPRIEYPGKSDIPAMFSVGQEFVIAWGALLVADDTPLHMVALWIMAFFASLTVLGVFGLAYELTGQKAGWGVLAACAYLTLQGNFRTLGFVLIREDFSIPWLALHLYFFARCLRLGSKASIAWAALFFVLAVSTWHAMGFMLTIEAAVVLGWYLRSGQNPMAHKNAWVMPAIACLGCIIVPVLWSKGFLFSLPMLIMASLWISALCERKEIGPARLRRLSAPIAVLVFALGIPFIAGLMGIATSDYSHVFELLTAKVTHMGQLPQDPAELSFDTRMLWQGPFATPDWRYFHGALGGMVAVLALSTLWAIGGWIRQKGDARILSLVGLVVGGTVSALLVRRTIVLPAFLLPVVAVIGIQYVRNIPGRLVLILLFFAYQLPGFSNWIIGYRSPWYFPPEHGQELAEVVRWIDQNVPKNEAISTDFLTGTAVLAHAGNPILVQPKYETMESRRRIETFVNEFMNGTVDGYRALMKENGCRVLLTNQDYWRGNAYIAGIKPTPGKMPDLNSPWFNFCNPDLRVAGNIPGFQLIFTSPDLFAQGRMRVFRMIPKPGN
jgi:hypothetical protein